MDDIKHASHGRGYFVAIAALGLVTVALAALFAEQIISPALESLLESHNVHWWLPALFTFVIFVILNFVISTSSVSRYLANFAIIIGFKTLLTVSTALIFMLKWDATTALQKAAFHSPVTALLHVVGAFLLTLFFSAYYFAEEELEEEIPVRFAHPGLKIPEMEEAEEIEEPAEVDLSLVVPEDAGDREDEIAEEVAAPSVPQVEAQGEVAGAALPDLADEETSEAAVPEIPVEEICSADEETSEAAVPEIPVEEICSADEETSEAAVPEIPVEEICSEEIPAAPEEVAAGAAGLEKPSFELPEIPADDVAKYRDAVLISVESIMSQIPQEYVGMSCEQVKDAVGADAGLWFPLAEILRQLPEGEVKWDASDVLSRLPDGAINKPVDEVAGKILEGGFRLPLSQIIGQVPGEHLALAGEIAEKAGEELPDLFAEVEGEEEVVAGAPAEPEPEAIEQAEKVDEAPVEGGELPAEPELEEPAPLEQAAPLAEEALPEFEGTVVVSFESILGQLDPEDVSMSAEQVRDASGADGLSFPISDVLGQISEGIVRVDAGGVLVRLPEGALKRTVIEVVAGLPGGKIELPLSEIIPQLPREAVELKRPEPAGIDEVYPDLFQEGSATEEETALPAEEVEREAEEGAEHVEETVEAAEEAMAASEPAEEPVEGLEGVLAEERTGEGVPHAVPETDRADEKEEVVFVSIESILSQVPQEDLAMNADEVKTSGQDRLAFPAEEIVPGLAEGEVKWDAEDVLSRLPTGVLSKPASDVAKEIEGGLFKLPLEEIVRQVPLEWLKLEHATADEKVEELPDIFHDQVAEAEGAPAESAAVTPAETLVPDEVEAEESLELEAVESEEAAASPPEEEAASVIVDSAGTVEEVPRGAEPPVEEQPAKIAESRGEQPSLPVGTEGLHAGEDTPVLDEVDGTAELVAGEPGLGTPEESPGDEPCPDSEPSAVEEELFEPAELTIDGTISLAGETPSYEPAGDTGTISEPLASPLEEEEAPSGEAPYVEETVLSDEAPEAGIGLEEAGATVGSIFSMAEKMGESGESIGGAVPGSAEAAETSTRIGGGDQTVSSGGPPADEEEFDLTEDCIRVSARYILAQLPRNALGMSIDLIETKLKTPGKILVPYRVVIPQLGSGLVEVEFVRLLPQFPKRAFVPPAENVVSKLPNGKVEIGMKEVILQLPLEVLLEHEDEQPWEDAAYVPEPVDKAGEEPIQREAETVNEARLDETKEEKIAAEQKEVTHETPAAETPEGEKEEEAAFEASLEKQEGPVPDLVAPEPDELRLARDSGPLPEEFKMDLSSLNLIPPAAVEHEAEQAEGERGEAAVEEKTIGEKVSGAEEPAPTEGAAVSPFEGLELTEGIGEEAMPEKVEFVDYESEAAEGEAAEKAPPTAEEEPGDKAPKGADEIEALLEGGRKEAPTEEESLASMFGDLTGEPEAPVEKAAEKAHEELEKIAAPRSGGAIEKEIEALPSLEPEGKSAEEETAVEEAERGKGIPLETPKMFPLPQEAGLALKKVTSLFGRLNLSRGEMYRSDSLSLVVLTDEETAGAEVARSTANTVKMLGEFMAGYGLGDLRKAVALGGSGVVAAVTVGSFADGKVIIAAERDTAMAGQLGVFIEKRIGIFDVVFGAVEGKTEGLVGKRSVGPSFEMNAVTGESFEELMAVLSDAGIDRCVRLDYADGPQVVLCYPSDFPEELLKGGAPLFAPSTVIEMLDSLDFGPFRSIIFVSDKSVVTYSAVAGKIASGVLCVFPGPCREGLAKLKSEKVSGVISARGGEG
jgi:hypothetical protein